MAKSISLKDLSLGRAWISHSKVEIRDEILKHVMARFSDEKSVAKLLVANALDVQRLPKASSGHFKDRLILNEHRIAQMKKSLQVILSMRDPLAEVLESKRLKNGLQLSRVRAPLGTIFVIYESRPNVAIEAFALAIKSGNALILRGGKESSLTVKVFYEWMKEAALGVSKKYGYRGTPFLGIVDPNRMIVKALLKEKTQIDVVIPRGGAGLIEFVESETSIPIIKNDRGLCHVYVDQAADLDQALDIVVNAKCSRPSVCNAMETLLVHERIAENFLKRLYPVLKAQWVACPNTYRILGKKKGVRRATSRSFSTEYLDFVMNCKVVRSLDEALEHIARFGSRHSEAIVTRDKNTALKFMVRVDAAVTYHNASTRFTDGFEFGLGGEIGVSTQKLHVRGPVGLRELTSVRWIVEGTGQIRK